MADVSRAFDLYDILVNELAGSPTIFLFLIFIFILIFAAYMRMPNGVVVIIIFTFLLLMAGFFPYLLPFTLTLAAGFIGWNLYKIIRG